MPRIPPLADRLRARRHAARAVPLASAWLLLVALVAAPKSTAIAQDRVTMTFDLAKAKPFAGFGVQVWLAAPHQAEEEAMMRQLHVRYVRVSVSPHIPPAQLADHMSVRALLDVIANNETGPAIEAFNQFRTMASELGFDIHLISWEMPAPWRIELGAGNGFTRKAAAPDHIPDYANFIAAQLLWAKRMGFVPSTVELTNEPEGAWNTKYSPKEYDALLQQARATMAENGLGSIAIEGPGTGKVYEAAPFIAELKKTGDLRLVKDLSVHEYDTARYPEPVGLTHLPADVKRRADSLPIFVTEFNNSADPRWKRPPYDATAETRGGANNAANSADYGVSGAGEALKLIGDGARAIFFWQAQDQPWGHDSSGLLDLQGHPRPVVAALSTFLSLLPPDVPAVGGVSPAHELAGVAFRRQGDVVVAIANLSTQPYHVQVKLSGLTRPATSVASLAQFQANGPAAAPGTSVITAVGGVVNLSLQPRAIASVTLR